MSLYDCIVIGAGPAGASAAYHLAKGGRSVLILEKAALPRYKPCGGGVSPQIAQWFDFDFTPAISTVVTEISFTWNQGEEVISEIQSPACVWMVRRDQFDHFLVQKAQEQGATLLHSTKALGISLSNGVWTVQTTGEPVQGRYLIAADGGKGMVAKWLGFAHRQQYVAGAIEIEPRLAVEHTHRAYFEFGLLKNGYVWNFPKSDGYSLGSGVFNSNQRKSRDLNPSLSQYSRQFGVDATAVKTHGHPLLLWNGPQRLHTEQALLAGEAAAVVDPFTAEGIRPAIFSGIKAAEAIDRALGGDLDALANYSQVMNQDWGDEMRWAQRLAALFYRFPKLGYQLGVKSPSGVAKMVKIFTGEMGYSDVIQRVQQKFLPYLGNLKGF
jgi:geranylgeranyl reductase family protein